MPCVEEQKGQASLNFKAGPASQFVGMDTILSFMGASLLDEAQQHKLVSIEQTHRYCCATYCSKSVFMELCWIITWDLLLLLFFQKMIS